MIFSDVKAIERDSRTKSLAVSATYAIAVLLLLMFSKCDISDHTEETQELGGGGVTVALGYPDQGFLNQNNDRGDNGGVKDPSPTPPTPSPTPSPSPASPPTVVTSDEESDYVVQKRKEIENKKRVEKEQMDEVIRQNKKELDAQQQESKRKQQEIDAEIKRKSDEKAKYDAAKANTGGLFGKKPGSPTGTGGAGAGDGGKPGPGGAPNGDPNSKNYHGDGGDGGGSGGGSGGGIGPSIGGGLGGRKIVSRPPALRDNSQDVGLVVLNVCVDEDGNVTSANQKLQGSTTTKSNLVSKAIENAKKYRFGKGDSGDCGTVTYKFTF